MGGGGGGSSSAAGRRSMRARTWAGVRTPQGVGAVLFVVVGAIVGAAVVAWRRHAFGCDGEDAESDHVEQAVSEEVLDGGVLEEEEGELDQSDQNVSRDDIWVEANGLDDKGTEELHQIQNLKATEEVHEIQEEDEIVKDGSDGEPVEKFDQNTSRESSEIVADDTDEEPVEKFDQNSVRGSAEIIADETDSGEMENADEDSSKNNVEDEITPDATEVVDNSDQSTLSISCSEIVHEEHPEHNDGGQDTALIQTTPTRQMMMHNQQFSEEAKTDTVAESAEIIVDDTLQDSGDMENADENSSKNDVENEITLNETEGVDNSDQSTLSITSSVIVPEEDRENNDGAQDTAPTETTPIETMMQQQQFSEEAKTDTVAEAPEAEPEKGTTMEKNVFEQEDQKLLAEPAKVATSPVSPSLPSLLKSSEKKGFANPGWNKTGMKLKHDSTKGALSKGVTMDRRAASMAILTLIFAVTIGVNIIIRLYSSLQAA